jgi:hypothetical protein
VAARSIDPWPAAEHVAPERWGRHRLGILRPCALSCQFGALEWLPLCQRPQGLTIGDAKPASSDGVFPTQASGP